LLLASSVSAASFAAGCGVEEGGGEEDAGTEENTDCPLPAAYTDLGLVEGGASSGPYWRAFLPGAEGALLNIFLIPDRGVFEEGLATGVYELAGDEFQTDTCGACVWLAYPYPGHPDSPPEHYSVRGGTLTITDLGFSKKNSVVPDHMTGSLSNAGFVHIVAPDDPTPAADGCETSIERLEFDDPITYTD
jgi:hypothetical protein